MELIDKAAVIAEIEKLISNGQVKLQEAQECNDDESYVAWSEHIATCIKILSILNTFEVIDPYEECVQYASIKAGIQAHAETYSFNIESELFNQLAKEQQGLWRKEIEQACISGGEVGVELARDPRYKENLEMKEVDLDKEIDDYIDTMEAWEIQEAPLTSIENTAKHFYELGIKSKRK